MPLRRPPRFAVLVALAAGLAAGSPAAEPPPPGVGVPVRYRLPTDGPLPRTYRVTLAVTDPKNPEWVVGQFARGVVRTVTAENGGAFTETWDGLDDNHMPVPPGTYGVKGICMPARPWAVDGEYHTVTPRFAGGASAFLPPPGERAAAVPFGGDPCGAPLRDVAVGPNGVAVFYYQYLENGTNCPLVDLKKPVGLGQFVRASSSGGAGGGTACATDGETVWAFSTDGGPKYVYRADGKPFGKSPGANRPNSYPPAGWVTAMAAAKTAAGGPVVYVAQRGRVVKAKNDYAESETGFADVVTAHNGATGKVLATVPLARPRGLAVRGGGLFALHADGAGFAVSRAALADGVPAGGWKPVFAVPASITPVDLEVDSRGRFYLSDPRANKVFQLDAAGAVTRTFGRLDAQTPGRYDPDTFMAPGKLATWVDPEGNDRLLVVEDVGPNRVSEWSADGRRLREWLSLQTKANDGYAIDPDRPGQVYVLGHGSWLTRFAVDPATRAWAVDAVWPEVGIDPRCPGFEKPQVVRANGQTFLACGRTLNVYRLAGNRWVLSAAVLHERDAKGKVAAALWHDADGNGRVDPAEVRPTAAPPGVLMYHGQNWLDDLSLAAVGQGTRDVWRLAPGGFDPHGNPVFKEWKKLLTDPVFAARTAGTADATHGGNELADSFASDWAQVDGTVADGFYVQARGGRNFSANEGPQHTVSRYVPDGAGGYRLKWRVGRSALGGVAAAGEMYGAMRVRRPINGLLSVIDQSRCGVLLYTDDGLYVDTVFPDERTAERKSAGLYPQPGEFFAGVVVPDRATGKITFGLGKFTPLLFEADGWSLTENPVRPLADVQESVTITAAQTASPPEVALSLRGGAGTAKVARFAPALGGAALDGSLAGWESCEPVRFAADAGRTVELRCLYDPDHLYLRWHARLGAAVDVQPLPQPERIFTHDRRADTLSLYFQGDPAAAPGGPAGGRPGDARFVFSLAKTGDRVVPVAVGMYPEWGGPGASPQEYRTPVGRAAFAHVGPVAGVTLGHAVDADGKGFVLAAAVPRAAVPRQARPFAGGLRTLANFEATFAGRTKVWWANADGSASREAFDEPTEARLYPGAWAPVQFQGFDGGVTVRNWLVCGPFGGPRAEKLTADPNGTMPGTDRNWKDATRAFCEAAKYPPDDGAVDLSAAFTGPVVRGYWPDPGTVRWKPATVADLDTRVKFGPSGQVWYAATWVHVPAATTLTFRFQGHPQTDLRWAVNGTPVTGSKPMAGGGDRPVTVAPVPLQAGWNRVTLRGYCTGYPPFRAGLVLDGPPDALWAVQLRAAPPEQ